MLSCAGSDWSKAYGLLWGKLMITPLSIMLRYGNFKEKTDPDCCIKTHIVL